MRSLSLFLLGTVLAVQPVSAQDAPQQGDVVVHGATKEETKKLVEALTPSRYGLQLARWNDQICPEVIGLDDAHRDYVARRIKEEAQSLRVELRKSATCTSNIVIIFTDTADALSADVIKNYPGLIRDTDKFGLPHAADRAPYLASRPVRWFWVTGTRMVGNILSRIAKTTVENTRLSLIIVDNTKLGGLKWSQLAAYIAMVALSHPDMDTDYSNNDTILSLFQRRESAEPAPMSLTDQDQVFLKALYNSNPNLEADQQRNQIFRALRNPAPKSGG